MAVNSSSSNDSDLPLQQSSNNSPFYFHCLIFPPGSIIFTTFNITYILLLLPLCIFILHHGLKQWRQKRSTSSAATVSHCDCFTYHMVVVELFGVCGCLLCYCGFNIKEFNVVFIGGSLVYGTWFGETFFHILTCVERYLAVVHPITYLSLRNQRGIRIRNISITCVWLLCFAKFVEIMHQYLIAVDLVLLLLSLIVISFCSLSVLCVLIRPGPGEQGGGRERVDQSKKRAFYMIMSILGVLVMRFAWCLFWALLYLSERNDHCVILTSSLWSNLPSSLVLPLLFLYREGKFGCCKMNIQ